MRNRISIMNLLKVITIYIILSLGCFTTKSKWVYIIILSVVFLIIGLTSRYVSFFDIDKSKKVAILKYYKLFIIEVKLEIPLNSIKYKFKEKMVGTSWEKILYIYTNHKSKLPFKVTNKLYNDLKIKEFLEILEENRIESNG